MATLVTVTCLECGGSVFSIPHELFHAAQQDPKVTFYCPYGHALHFAVKAIPEGQSNTKEITKRDNVISLEEYRIKINEKQ